MRAAREVVAREGFHAASVDAIATRAGYSIGALYWNFSSKDELFLAVFDEHVSWFEHQLEQAAADEDRGRALREWIDRICSDPQQFLIFIEFWAYAVRKPKTRRELAARLKQMRARVVDVVGDDRVALLCLAAARGLTIDKLADPDDGVYDEVLDQLAGFTLD